MQYECKEAMTLDCNDVCPFVSSENYTLIKAPMKKYLLDKVLPVTAHIISLLIGGGIVIIFSHFVG